MEEKRNKTFQDLSKITLNMVKYNNDLNLGTLAYLIKYTITELPSKEDMVTRIKFKIFRSCCKLCYITIKCCDSVSKRDMSKQILYMTYLLVASDLDKSYKFYIPRNIVTNGYTTDIYYIFISRMDQMIKLINESDSAEIYIEGLKKSHYDLLRFILEIKN